MKNTFLIGTLILTSFLASLIPASVEAIDGSGFMGIIIIGDGTATYRERSVRVSAKFLLQVNANTHGTGIAQLAFQAGSYFDQDINGTIPISWSYNPTNRELIIWGVFGTELPRILYLTGIVDSTPQTFPDGAALRGHIELTGGIVVETEIVQLNLVANLFGVPNVRRLLG